MLNYIVSYYINIRAQGVSPGGGTSAEVTKWAQRILQRCRNRWIDTNPLENWCQNHGIDTNPLENWCQNHGIDTNPLEIGDMTEPLDWRKSSRQFVPEPWNWHKSSRHARTTEWHKSSRNWWHVRTFRLTQILSKIGARTTELTQIQSKLATWQNHFIHANPLDNWRRNH